MSRAKKPLLLFFASSRSGPCRRMESVLAQLARKERQRVDIARVELDGHAELAARLGVSAAPTLVLVVDRRVVGRLSGRASATKIEALLDAKLGVATPA